MLRLKAVKRFNPAISAVIPYTSLSFGAGRGEVSSLKDWEKNKATASDDEVRHNRKTPASTAIASATAVKNQGTSEND